VKVTAPQQSVRSEHAHRVAAERGLQLEHPYALLACGTQQVVSDSVLILGKTSHLPRSLGGVARRCALDWFKVVERKQNFRARIPDNSRRYQS
jgi:hypothetical protein